MTSRVATSTGTRGGAVHCDLLAGLDRRTGASGDILSPGLRLLLVAINPSLKSETLGRPFSSPTNSFWRLLHASGLTPVLIAPDNARLLLEFGIGLTSVAGRATRLASEVTTVERIVGAERVRELVCRVQPQVVGLLGATLGPLFLDGSERKGVGWKRMRISGSAVYVLPNPSGRNRSYPGFSTKLRWYRDLAAHWL